MIGGLDSIAVRSREAGRSGGFYLETRGSRHSRVCFEVSAGQSWLWIWEPESVGMAFEASYSDS